MSTYTLTAENFYLYNTKHERDRKLLTNLKHVHIYLD